MTRRLLAGTTLAALLLAGSGATEEPLTSGIPVGQGNRGAFEPKHIAGPDAGSDNCPV